MVQEHRLVFDVGNIKENTIKGAGKIFKKVDSSFIDHIYSKTEKSDIEIQLFLFFIEIVVKILFDVEECEVGGFETGKHED